MFPEIVPYVWLNVIVVVLLIGFGWTVGCAFAAWLVGKVLR